MIRLVMWDIDRTLLHGGGVAAQAWKSAFTAVTGKPWRAFPIFGGRTDLDICAEVFEVHGVDDCTPETFFARYADEVHANRHRFAEVGAILPGVRDVLTALSDVDGVVQTIVTGNIPEVAALKLGAFDLGWAFDAEVGGWGTDDSVRARVVRRSRQRAAAKYGMDLDVVVIGDTTNDVTAALANDALAVGVATGQNSANELRQAGAHHVLGDLCEVDAVVRLLSGRDRVG